MKQNLLLSLELCIVQEAVMVREVVCGIDLGEVAFIH